MSDKEEGSQPPAETPASDKSEEISIHIGNLAYSIDEARLKDIFSEYGEVSTTRIPVNDRQQSKGYGFVTMKKEDAERAIKALDNKEVDGRSIRVDISVPRKDHPRRSNYDRRERRRYEDDYDYDRDRRERRRYDDDRDRRERRRYYDYDRDRRYDERYDRYDRDRRYHDGY